MGWSLVGFVLRVVLASHRIEAKYSQLGTTGCIFLTVIFLRQIKKCQMIRQAWVFCLSNKISLESRNYELERFLLTNLGVLIPPMSIRGPIYRMGGTGIDTI